MNKKQIEKLNELLGRARAILEAAQTENRALTDEELQQVKDWKDEAAKLRQGMELEEQLRQLRIDRAEENRAEGTENPDRTKTEELEERAFDAYVRGIVLNTRDGETATNLTKGDNGAIVPTTIANRIIKRLYEICPILERSQRYNVKGKLDLPYYDTTTDSVTVAYQEEFTALTSHSGKFRSIQLTGFLAGALTKISVSLINNSQFNVVAFIVEDMAQSARRFVEHELLIGTEDKVLGLSTLTNGITAAGKTAVTADELIDLKDKVKDAFQKDAIWIMSTATRTAIRKLKDNVGRYLLNDDITSPFGTVLLGKPVYVTDNMPEMQAGGRAIYYGDMTGLATKFSETMSVQILREKFADEHAVGAILWTEFDAKVQDEQRLAVLTMKAN